MRTFRVFTPQFAFDLNAPTLEDAMSVVQGQAPMKRGWTCSWVTKPEWPNRLTLRLYNSKGALVKTTGATLVEVAE